MYNMCIQYVIDCVCLVQRNYKGLKITVCLHSWGKLWTIKYKKIPTASSEKLGPKAESCKEHHERSWQTT